MRLLILFRVAVIAIGSDEGDPLGHMQPIGSHRPPEENLTSLSYVPDPEEFYENFVFTHTPVLFKGAIAGTPAITKWNNDNYLSDSFGDASVAYEIGKKEDRNGPNNVTTMADFLKRYKEEDIYMVSDMPVDMEKEWQVPRCLLCGGYIGNLNMCLMWFSSGGTKSVLHTDGYENLHCLVSGIKEFVMIHPDYTKVIGPEHDGLGYYHIDVERRFCLTGHEILSMPGLHVWDGKKSVCQENVSVYFGDFNEVNVWNLLKTLCSKAMVSQPSSLCDELKMVNMTSHPGMMEVPWYHVRVEPGDCLYLPNNWIHHVSSHGRNLGVNIWWSNFRFRRDRCPQKMDDVPDFMPLSEFNLHPDKQIASVFLALARDDGYVYAEDLAADKLLSMYSKETVLWIFEILDPGCGGKLLVSKLANDEIPQERYEKLEEFLDRLEYGKDEIDEVTFSLENGLLDDHDDDIEVPSKEEVIQFYKQNFKKAHNEL